jgi:hypothetical protein
MFSILFIIALILLLFSLCTDCITLQHSLWKFVALLVDPQQRYPDLSSWFWLVIVKLIRFWLAEFKREQSSDFSG